ncbi:hypothetical protein J0910_01275 [Nocardiopsis sp. CNT-189]|uniref:hypothetical protein n=1 Tax=Nocardiopsis oceanisediminis TaxID=2816862 RepID=UPI003B319DAF
MKIRLAVMASAVVLTTALTGTPASAAIIPCTQNNVDPPWGPVCDRRPTDGDAGGVSGSVRVEYLRNTKYHASIRFEAKGEHIYFNNNTTTGATLALYMRDDLGSWRPYYKYALEAGGSEYVNAKLGEDRAVRLQVEVHGRGTAWLSTLRT